MLRFAPQADRHTNRPAAFLFVAVLVLLLTSGCGRSGPAPAAVRLLEAENDAARTLAEGIRVLLPDAQAGVAIAWVDAGRVGFAFAGNEALSADTRFEFGSITKVATAHLVARRLRSGALDLETPLPALPGGAELGTAWSGTTLRQLLTHSSGLAAWPPNWGPVRIVLSGSLGDPFAPYDAEDLRNGMRRQRRPTPGARWTYSNYGFAVLGHVLEVESGRGYAALLQDELLDPIGLRTASLARLDGDVAPPRSRRGRDATRWSFDAFAPAGALGGTLRDALGLLHHAIDACAGSDEVARATCLAQQPQGFRMNDASEMGLGWVRTTRGAETIVWHNGGTGGYSTFLGFVEGAARGVVVLTNVGFLREIDALAMDALVPVPETP